MSTTPTPKPSETAQSIIEAANRLGFDLSVSGCVLTITKQFSPGSNDGFVECDMTYYDVLGLLPQTAAGSVWGTDGGGIGGMVALKSGHFKMNKSGGSKRVLSAIARMIGV